MDWYWPVWAGICGVYGVATYLFGLWHRGYLQRRGDLP